jgi:hypothetical protein
LIEIYLPEVKAAIASTQHHPEQVSTLLNSAAPYLLVAKAPQLLGLASFAMKDPRQAVADFAPGLRYRGLALGESTQGSSQAPDYVLRLLGTSSTGPPRPPVTIDCSTSGKMPTPISSPPRKPAANVPH